METDHSWRQEYLASKPRLSAFQKELLTNGPKGLSQAWILGAMHNEWKVQKYGKEPEPKSLQSSFKDFNRKYNGT